ncbi:MAG: family 10 glycosylhydrolase [Lachnoclostridium sp.]|nr:family 10 glycosylhydrolase [Lachnoclostridium sp.]
MKRIFGLIIIAILMTGCCMAAGHEMRGVWIATVYGIDWPSSQGDTDAVIRRQQQEMTRLLDRCADLKLTTIFFQVRSMSDAMYRSSLEPWSQYISGKRGQNPGWDPLLWMVEECHARGMECYAWINPFRVSSGKTADTEYDRRWRKKGWLLTYDKYTVMNPGIEEVREHIVNVCHEIADNYRIDGLIFDDYFYPNRIPSDSSAPDYDLYIESNPAVSFADWRRNNVHKLVADVRSMLFDNHPDIKFAISPAGVAGKHDTSAGRWGVTPVGVKAADWQWNEIYSDPLAWLYQGTVDFISPQLYWPTDHATAPFLPLARWWDYSSSRHGRHAYPSISLADLDKNVTSDKIADHLLQINHSAEMSNPGIIFYSARFLSKIGDYLSDIYTTKVLPPATPWRYPHTYPAVNNLKKKGSRLTWNPVKPSFENAIVRYAVYAVPDDLSEEEIVDIEGSISSEYLLGITYNPAYELDTLPRGKFRYAVTVVDGNSTEHQAAWL